MTAALLFAASFAFVFTLGIQQMNVERRSKLAAFLTSLLIGLSQLVLFQVLPGPVQVVEVLAFLLGNGVGIVTSMWMHPHLVAMFSTPGYAGLAKRYARTNYKSALSPADKLAAKLGETLRLATELADDVTRSDIESFCVRIELDDVDWFDTHRPDVDFESGCVAKAVRYLELRNRLIRHTQQPHLVRFEQ